MKYYTLISFLFAIILFSSFSSASVWTNEYQIRVHASSINEPAVEINNVVVTDEGGGIFKINTTETDYEVARAQVMRTLFFGSGTTGSDPRVLNITSPTKIVTLDSRDVGKNAFFGSISAGTGDYTATFTDTTNNDNVSSWGSWIAFGSGASAFFELPSGSEIWGSTSTNADNLGTDNSVDERSNPPNATLSITSSPNNGLIYAMFLSSGNVSWAVTSGSPSNQKDTNFFDDYSIPTFSEEVNITDFTGNFTFPNAPFLFNTNYSTKFSNLSNATLYINGVLNETKAITGTFNTTQFNKTFSSLGNVSWYIESCTNESVCSQTQNNTLEVADYFENSITYTTPTVEGTTESFILNISTTSGVSVSSAFFVYNGTSYTTSVAVTNNTILTSTLNVPDFSSDANITFYWNITLSTGQNFVSTISTQEVLALQIDNCGVFTNTILNLSLFDERTLASIMGTIEVNLDLNNLDGSLVSELSTDLFNVSNGVVCSNINLTSGSYLYNLELRYYSSPDNGTTYNYVPEFYHIQSSAISTFPMAINLYDLNINESTEFTIFYRDNDYIARPNVLLQILRKYVSEGVYRTIEIPITSSQGTAFGHFDLDNYKYRILATENGVLLNTFDNPTIRCESELSGICEIFLNGQPPTSPVEHLTVEQNFVYSISTTNNSITLDYSIPNGESKTVDIIMVQSSPFATSNTICSQSLLSSSGSITCTIDETIGDSQVNVRLTSNSVVKADFTVIFEEDLQTGFALNNYFIGSIFLILVVTMFVSSPPLMILSSILGIAYLGLIFLLKSSSVGLAVGVIAWLLVSGIIILIKINKRNEV